jgi:hypothetical protein
VMTWPSPRTLVVALLLASLAAFCLSDLVEAAAPSADRMDCASLLCDLGTGCGSTSTKHVGAPVAALIALLPFSAPAPFIMPIAAAVPSTAPGRQVVPRAPRSPPAA